MYMARVFIERGNLGIFEDVVLDQGKGYSMVQCCSLSLTLIRVLGSMNTAHKGHTLYLCCATS